MMGEDKAPHPGRPPKGYRPITGLEALRARYADA
jgi:hypothetical protein